MKNSKRGFTLIEILLVVLIIGITLTFAVIKFGDFGQSRRERETINTLTHLITLIKYHALIENSVYKIKLNNKGYEVFHYIHGWKIIHATPLKSKQFNLDLHIKTKEITVSPDGIINPNKIVIQNETFTL
jgi:prepilin-type N-terminal cleavage/methylation domain-containing protein